MFSYNNKASNKTKKPRIKYYILIFTNKHNKYLNSLEIKALFLLFKKIFYINIHNTIIFFIIFNNFSIRMH